MKPCADKDCPTAGRKLPLSEFYEQPYTTTGRGAYCKSCAKRRTAADQKRRREARREQGLPSSEAAYKRLIFSQRVIA